MKRQPLNKIENEEIKVKIMAIPDEETKYRPEGRKVYYQNA